KVNKLGSGIIQHLNYSSNAAEALKKLGETLSGVILNAQGGFRWDHTRSPYPGLLPFGPDDAAVYFGRQADIRAIIERLNVRRYFGGAKLILLSGPSGVGKSSLLRAGILPRLNFDKENWLVLPPIRPGRDPDTNLSMLLQQVAKATLAQNDMTESYILISIDQ